VQKTIVLSIFSKANAAVDSHLMVIFQDNPGKLVSEWLHGAKDDGVGDNNWSYKISKDVVKPSPPTSQHLAYRMDALHVRQPAVSKH